MLLNRKFKFCRRQGSKTHMDFSTVHTGRACPFAVCGDRLAVGFRCDPHFPNPPLLRNFPSAAEGGGHPWEGKVRDRRLG